MALSTVGTKEAGKNRGELIDKANKLVNTALGSSWCTSIIFLWLELAKVQHEIPRTALARNLTKPNGSTSVLRALDVLNGKETIKKGDILVWQKGNTIFGHAGVATSDWAGKSGETVEGNTSSGVKGNQSDGDGIYKRKRTLSPFDYFRIKWIVRINEV